MITKAEEEKVKGEYGRCLTWRSFLALITGALLISPAVFYSQLTIGGSLGLVSSWLIVILWAELARLLGHPLTRQETLILQNFEIVVTWAAALFILPGTWGGMFGLVWRVFYANSPVIYQFGYAKDLPWWFIPPRDSPIMTGMLRTVFHSSWALPLTITLATVLLGWMMSISLGYLCYQIFVVAERLDFPLQSATAIGVISIAEHGPGYSAFIVSAAIGAFLAIPGPLLLSVTGGAVQIGMQAISLNVAVEQILPGASFGLLPDIFAAVAGLLLDPKIVIAFSVPAWVVYFLGNHMLVRFGIWPTGELEMGAWMPGATEEYCIWWSQIRVWTSVQFGLAAVGAVMPMIVHRDTFLRGFRALSRLSEAQKREGLIPLKYIVLIYLASSTALVAITSWITPEFPWYWNALLTIVWSFAATLVASGMAGLTSSGFSIPWLKQGFASFFGVQSNPNIWFSPLQLMNTGGASWVGQFKMARMCRIRLSEYTLVWFLSWVLGLISGVLFTSIFWSFAPIPSGAYPRTMIDWTNQAYWQCLFMKWFEKGVVLKLEFIVPSIIVGVGLYLVLVWRKITTLFYAILIGISLSGGYGFSGSGALMYDALPMFLLGSLIGKYFIGRRLNRWGEQRYSVAAGLIAGYSIVGTLAAAISLISKAQWILPY
jgi:hypothetical protein